MRLPLGILTDRFGGRIVFFIQMILVAIPTYGLAFADQDWQYLVVGLFVGLAGGSFAVGIAYTSAWFSKERQGTAMGIFGAGNAGAAVTNLVAPLILVAYGWRAVTAGTGRASAGSSIDAFPAMSSIGECCAKCQPHWTSFSAPMT